VNGQVGVKPSHYRVSIDGELPTINATSFRNRSVLWDHRAGYGLETECCGPPTGPNVVDGKGEVTGGHLFVLDSGASPIDVNVDMKQRENYTSSNKDYDVYGHGMHIARRPRRGTTGLVSWVLHPMQFHLVAM
jgi:hypothetical protein